MKVLAWSDQRDVVVFNEMGKALGEIVLGNTHLKHIDFEISTHWQYQVDSWIDLFIIIKYPYFSFQKCFVLSLFCLILA